MSSYRCVLFDLDHTLWDYERNSREALSEVYSLHQLSVVSPRPFEDFYQSFKEVNTRMWDEYDRSLIPGDLIRSQRFHRVLLQVGVEDYELSLKLSADYIRLSPQKNHLTPHALEILDYLKEKYPLLIVTNGFREIQSTKLQSSRIDGYFHHVVTSEAAGHKKPSPEIFRYALDKTGVSPREAVMIGDNLLTDIAGARNAQIDTIFYNPDKTPHQEEVTHEIGSLIELKGLL